LKKTVLPRRSVNLKHLVYFSFLSGILTTLLGNYVFGEGAFLEIHPMVRAVMDADYLPGDMVATAAREFGPRFYFNQLLAFFATPESLPIAFFVATLLVNVAIALVTGLLARDLFKSDLAGIVAVAIVMSVSMFKLGGTSEIFARQINANRLAWPFSTLGIWAAYRNRPLLTGLAAGAATILHPTFGLELGLLSLGALALAILFRRPSAREAAKGMIPVLGGFAVLGAFTLAWIIPYGGSEIPFEDFRQIRLLRTAHELLPSSFPLVEWVKAAFFMTGAGFAWRWTRRRNVPPGLASAFFGAMVIGILAALAGGYLFIELYPLKSWLIADPFHRLPPVFTWLGLIAVAGGIAMRLVDEEFESGGFLYATTVNAFAIGLGHVLVGTRDEGRLSRVSSSRRAWRILPWSILVGIVVFTTPFPDLRNIGQFVAISTVAAWVVLAPKRWRPILVPGLATGALAVLLIGAQSIGGLPRLIDEIGPEVLPSHREGFVIDIGERTKTATPGDALVLIPPKMGDLRITAERAVLVDFKAIPYQEDWMLEWRDRIITAYGEPRTLGADASDELEASFRFVTDDHINSLCRQYGITHAVLYRETATDFEVLESNEMYSLVEVGDC
jgi:hypothetical protein